MFVNYSWLDSSVDDGFGDRRFNNPARYVSYRKQGDAELRVLAEELSTSYGADREVFIEKRFGENLSVRPTGSNLLDASKDEVFDKFDNAFDQIDRDYDEYELETESAGPVYQLIARYSF